MKFMKLLTAAYVGGSLRHPHEGVLHVEDAEAERLIEDQVAEDVTDDFSAAQKKELPAETISAPGGRVDTPVPENPHQVEVAPQAAEPSTPAPARKAAAHKE